MASSVLSGIFFASIISAKGKSVSFWQKHAGKLIVVSLWCCVLDIINGLAAVYARPLLFSRS